MAIIEARELTKQFGELKVVDSVVYINDSQDIILERVIFKDLNKYERADSSG